MAAGEIHSDAPPEEQAKARYDFNEWALVYLVTKSGGHRGNLWILKTEDAQKLCSDKCSHGEAKGGHWIFMWTTLHHFFHQNDTYDGRREKFVFVKDSGKQDKDFERLGIIKPSWSEVCNIVNDLGYSPIVKK